VNVLKAQSVKVWKLEKDVCLGSTQDLNTTSYNHIFMTDLLLRRSISIDGTTSLQIDLEWSRNLIDWTQYH